MRARQTIQVILDTLFFYVFCVFWTGLVAWVAAVPVAVVERVLGLNQTQWAQMVLFRGIRLCSLPLRLVTDVRIDGEQALPEESCVVICNHQSYLDIALLFHVFPRIHMTARASLFYIPFLGWAMKLLQHIPHKDERPSEAIDRAEFWLQHGTYVGIFPEGTRSLDSKFNRFHSGAFRLAQRTTHVVQPVVVAGTGRVWGKGKVLVRHLGPVGLRILPRMFVAPDLDRTGLRARIKEIRAAMEQEKERLERDLCLSPGEKAQS